ncbi:Protein of unknown function [Natronincola peptidivorans]|uniref:Uncharacterized protein n=1 Tax=Natronincola peptidivorans TaxID=426128 RepID=A0A1H9Z274_9FIRM|nr:DUF3006 domain-containing protein [Natronincola peptidivorans]SES75604.1 Protein of unknown function [Natronincola peptidivorans]
MIVLDRLEENIAVLETEGNFLKVNINIISTNAKEGDVLVFNNGYYTVDAILTEKRKKILQKKCDSIWE